MKRWIATLTALFLMVSMTGILVLQSSAEDTVKIAYGSDEIQLTPVDALDDAAHVVDGSYGWGTATFGDGKILIETNQMFDAYGMDTEAFGSFDWAGMKYIVFSVENTSDGDIYLCFQPTVPGAGNAFTSGALAKDNPVKLVSAKDGTAKDAKFSGTQAINNRDCFIIPYRFTGYVFLPVGIIADLNSLSVPSFTGDASFQSYGFHVVPDDATYVELTILDVYACGDLPEYNEPVVTTEAPTEAPTEEPTEAATDPVVTEPETTEQETTVPEPETTVEQATEAPTEAPSVESVSDTKGGDSSTVADETAGGSTDTGCSSVLGLSVLSPMFALAVTAAVVRKRKH